jgi:hypothetical protein
MPHPPPAESTGREEEEEEEINDTTRGERERERERLRLGEREGLVTATPRGRVTPPMLTEAPKKVRGRSAQPASD